MRITLILLLAVSPLWSKRPNVVFLVSEDNSIHYLKHYGAKFGAMPNIEKTAAVGLTFDHAFSNAPVCSVARSDLGHWHTGPQRRLPVSLKIRPAKGVKPWTALLRKAGYYCYQQQQDGLQFSYRQGRGLERILKESLLAQASGQERAFFLHAVLWRLP